MGGGDLESGTIWHRRKNGTSRPGRDDLVRDGFGATSPGTSCTIGGLIIIKTLSWVVRVNSAALILKYVTLQSTRWSFINALYELVGSTKEEELLWLILDPSMACAHSGNSDEPWLTRIYSLTRGLCYALHVQRNPSLASL